MYWLARIGGLCHWPAVPRSIYYAGERLAYRMFPSSPFLFPYYMISIMSLFFIIYSFIHICCLICAVLMLKLGCCFLCNWYVLCILLLSILQIVLCMHCCMYCIWVCKFRWGLCWLVFLLVVDILYLWLVRLHLSLFVCLKRFEEPIHHVTY